MKNKTAFELRYRMDWLSVIYKTNTGYLFTNQSGGHACRHPEVEGLFLPLERSEVSKENCYEIYAYFCGEKWKCWCADGIDEETADFLDARLEKSGLMVNRDRLNESWEAWIQCFVPENAESRLPAGDYILVWGNSD